MDSAAPPASEIAISYGPLEEIPGETEEFVTLPPARHLSKLFRAGEQRLEVERRPLVGRKRFETWRDADGNDYGRWDWERRSAR